VLDEATSALDNGTQARAMATVLSMAATRFVIAHRISTIRHAHRILMLDNGRIVESGTFTELMAKQGAFARLASAQA
jgi:ABC-type multidrug transport system fused ATPase/permease subunit